jgi:membrane-bound serine protease (ClpP class)
MTNDPRYAILLLTILFACFLVAVTLIAYRSRRQKTRTDDSPLVGSGAVVDKQLNPEGTVLVRGELWNACSLSGGIIPSLTQVKVVGLRAHILLVEDFRD